MRGDSRGPPWTAARGGSACSSVPPRKATEVANALQLKEAGGTAEGLEAGGGGADTEPVGE